MRKYTICMKVSVFVVLIAAAALFSGVPAPGDAYAGREALAIVSPVPHPEVCMVTDRVFGKPQIPVEFEGKTYYGCCMGCVGRIQSDRSVRYGTDPVSGREVDKAVAFIVEGPGGEALYFESAESAAAYASRVGAK